jgi:membrane-bound ClpP family serine protease
MCHFLILLPLVSLPLYSILPWQEATALYTLINGPLLIAGWLVWRVHRKQPITGHEGMIGRRAVILTPLAPEGKVRCGNELWQARSSDPVAVGDEVRVERLEKTTLIVCANRDAEEQNAGQKLRKEGQR